MPDVPESDPRFHEFVILQAQNAGLFLGQIPNPHSGEKSVNLRAAKSVIDSLEMLASKTRGNLAASESKLLSMALKNLTPLYENALAEIRGELIHLFLFKSQISNFVLSTPMSFDPFNIGNVPVGGPVPFFILGPCALESEAFAWEMARSLKEIAERTGIHFLFKASFDKANRTSVDSFRGPGIKEGCRILGEISKELNVPVTTDIHTAEQADIAAEHIDLLQIPAFLCRQTDMLEAAAKTGRAVNVKKGQFLAPWDTVNIAGKMRAFGCEKFLITERGTTFGYNNLIADMRSLYWMRKEGLPVIFDATHSVQRPGGLGGTTGGDGELAPVLARAAVATGVDGLFMEVHSDPANAMSDGPNQIPLEFIEDLLIKLISIHHAAH